MNVRTRTKEHTGTPDGRTRQTWVRARIGAGIAAIGVAALSLAIAVPADASNKHDGGGGGSTIVQPADNGRELDPAQLAAGALGGITVAGAAFAATVRLRRHGNSAPRPV